MYGRLGLLVTGVLILAVLLSPDYQKIIINRLISMIVPPRVGTALSPSAFLSDDDLHVIFCGTGSPLGSERAGACTMILAGGSIFIFDVGQDSPANIAKISQSAGRMDVDGVFLTHFHSDHIDGLPALLTTTMTRRQGPIDVYGPPGVADVVTGVNMFHAPDRQYRLAHHNRFGRTPFQLDGGVGIPHTIELDASGYAEVSVHNAPEGFRVTAFRVDHEPVAPAFGYIVEYKGKKIVFSGDTKPTPLLDQAAQGADVLIHEVLDEGMLDVAINALNSHGLDYNTQVAWLLRDTTDYHTTIAQAVHTAYQAEAMALVFSHIAAPGSSNPLILRKMQLEAAEHVEALQKNDRKSGVKEAHDLRMIWADDGLHIRLSLDPSSTPQVDNLL